MTILDAMLAGDVYLDYPYEEVKFRYEKATGKAYRRFSGQAEGEVPLTNALFTLAISEGKQITREAYFLD